MNISDLDHDRDVTRIGDLMSRIRDELDALEALLPAAIDAQWTAAPVARPREDTTERMKNTRSDPTADVATDSARLHLREQVVRSAHVLAGGIATLRRVRRDVGDALTPWCGEGNA
ncbi:hypothetical protein [Micromonospora sp. KC213]|uniref:DUF7169 domain-containing protein n=1 Tax=Micromonospora sp. KC213 TaxID=2530378 RepID=UPI0010505C61|nr:hypothetical protein [Micromonospora sp. KC213]TDC35709.1 hypothetical protein E1166_23215 [Micromonospora sp. KC213]